ncbi:MAG: 23S rRNA (pseudouridine(1915)-N(3))-methyltransferase RlmH [Erysipelotrichaceae bacterium]|nr:23S rRNA (pseudouridine(1915)-N(3))-methyltransferase RlmH [Erysipelotrichaceae bacterium]
MIKIVCVGKVKDKNLAALISEYAEKINHYHKLEIVEVKDEAIKDNEQAVLDKEAESVLSKIRDDEYVILLDLHGKSIDSIGLANKLDRLFISNPRITFVIGGSLGLSDKLRKRANEKLKLSDLTFLHQMTRLIILEQIYRCFKILNNETYHK